VVSVPDGDTLRFLNGHHTERIRLSGINCPEKGQPFGQRAKQAASALALGKDVTIRTHGRDRYKRTLADVLLPYGMNLNQELVKHGWCWWYRKYAPGNTVLEGLEKQHERRGKACGSTSLTARAVSTQHKEHAHRIIGSTSLQLLAQEGTSWHSKSTCS
jgi:endonuclease YncB( thermonuclease family)